MTYLADNMHRPEFSSDSGWDAALDRPTVEELLATGTYNDAFGIGDDQWPAETARDLLLDFLYDWGQRTGNIETFYWRRQKYGPTIPSALERGGIDRVGAIWGFGNLVGDDPMLAKYAPHTSIYELPF